MKNKVYCTAPFNGITVRENGDVKTCCAGKTTLGNLNHTSIQDILKSTELENIQQHMLNGTTDLKNCFQCYQQEKHTGLASLKEHYLRFYPETHPTFKLKNLDIRWNNLCNLGCVYCDSTFSSVWEDRLSVRLIKPVKPYQDDLLKFIIDNIDQVDEIMLVGGEPMLMKQNYELLEKLPPTTQISIITNMSYNLDCLPCIESLRNRPKEKIKWNLSLENSGKKFEYVRNGADWNQVEKNINVLNQHWAENISINLVYSVFTAFDLVENLEIYQRFGIKKFMFQTYFGDPELDVFAMPAEIQNQASAELLRAKNVYHNFIHPEDRHLFVIQNADQILKHLESPKTHSKTVTKKQFYDRIEWCNQWNSSRFQDLWPNVIDLVDNHLT